MARIVLLADDSVTAQNMGRRIMTDAGYEVITVNNGSAALKKIHESHPDLIVLDVYMPGYGGLEVCQRLKESEATMKIPVLLTVGKMEPFKTDEAKRVHADGHIIKPFDASELLAALTRLEDKIVPSENGRGRRGKAETGTTVIKRPRTIGAADPAQTFDDSHTEQIQYLARVKRRPPVDEVPEAPDSPFAQAPANSSPALFDPETTVEMPAVVQTPSYEPPAATVVPEERDHTVTFASGPIYDPEPSVSASGDNQSVALFQTETGEEAESQARAAEDIGSSRSDASEFDSGPSGIDKVFSATQSESVAAFTVEPDLVPEGATDFSPAPQQEPAQRWVAENVAHTSEEAARSLEEEMQKATAASEAPETQAQLNSEPTPKPEPALETEWQPQSAPETDSGSGAAFAAAASASGSFEQTNAISLSSSDSEPPAGSESSAAWDNWQRIRDTVISKRASEAIAESAAAMTDTAASSRTELPASQPVKEAPSSQSGPNNDALSNIVDSVLAELKPRLLAEIAKQMAQDKK